MKNVYAILVLFLLVSCQKDSLVESNNLLIGIWESTDTVEENGVYFQIYSRKDDFDQKSCLVFAENDVFKSWDSGWCGTPPLSFHLTEGKYIQQQNLLTFDINHYFYHSKKLEIIELTEDILKVKYVQ